MTDDKGVEQAERGELQSADDLMEAIRHHLEGVWNAHYDNPETTQAIGEVDQVAQLLVAMVHQNEELMAQLMHTTELMQQQRDLAFADRDYWANETRDSGKKALAWAIAFGSDISEQDATRVIDQLTGESDLPVSQYTMWDLLQAFRQAARELSEEAMYLADADSPHPLAPSPTGEGEMESSGDY